MNGSFRALRLGSLSVLFRPRVALICALLFMVLLALAVLLMGTGTMPLPVAELLAILGGTGDNPAAEQIVMRVRLPRLLTGAFVGASLGMAGAMFQSVARNPLGSPDVIGFTTGAATGAIVQIVMFGAGPLATALAAMISGVATAAAVFLLSRKGGSAGGQRLVLVGIGIGATLSGLNTMLVVMGNLDRAMAAQVWLAGSLNMRTWWHVLPANMGFLLIAPIACWHGRRLSLLDMGDDMARQLGVATEKTRLVAVLAAVSLTSVATAAAGPITFVALAAPQLVRRLTRAPEIPMLPAALMGSVLLLAADLLSQRIAGNLVMPIGLTTGLLGGLYILWLLTRTGRR
ncbi:FecCD family ABC transporter permease [Paracoccus albus]|uniref:FecCD family ABC transporter permease n=1 Tax=Paracoccus albus TaxID=3017784 RepID=UPI0022F0EDF2|nr:iron chelate uptake ABC transporter family permease subunit [Paracoccus albus]WBU62149.1 iron chelate uptake ABC transporter family permease subunit [Paracoccus albus]